MKKIEKKIEKIFRVKFHSITKHFAVIDSNHTEKLDKEKFRFLMAKCGLKMTYEEVEHVWKGFEMESVPFSNLVRRFIIPEEFSKIRKIKDEIKQGNLIFL